MSKSIFKEALADAAAIKQAALASAKLAIEEQFSPALEAIINKKLAEDMEEGDGYSEEGHEKGKVPHDARSEKEKPLAEKKKSSEEKKSSEASEEKKSEEGAMDEDTKDIETLLRELEAQEDPSYTNYSDNEHMEEKAGYSSEEDKKTKPMDEKKKSSEEKKSSEAEVEEAKKKSKSSEADAAPSEHDADEYEKFLELKHKFEPKGAAGKKSSEADVKIDETDEEINKLIAELEKENSSEEHDESSEMDETDGYTEKPGHKDKQPYMKKEGSYSSEEDAKTKPMDEESQMRAELAQVRKELNEANLINAKAILFSKIVKENDNLKKDDKVKILKQLDKATSSREAKLIYETITESLKVNSNKQKTALKESIGFASAPAGNAPATRNPDNIIDEQFSRWQKLAGLNRK